MLLHLGFVIWMETHVCGSWSSCHSACSVGELLWRRRRRGNKYHRSWKVHNNASRKIFGEVQVSTRCVVATSRKTKVHLVLTLVFPLSEWVSERSSSPSIISLLLSIHSTIHLKVISARYSLSSILPRVNYLRPAAASCRLQFLGEFQFIFVCFVLSHNRCLCGQQRASLLCQKQGSTEKDPKGKWVHKYSFIMRNKLKISVILGLSTWPRGKEELISTTLHFIPAVSNLTSSLIKPLDHPTSRYSNSLHSR